VTQADQGSWRYAPGSGLLLGTGDRWLLLADQPDEGVILELWDALTFVGLDQALAVLERSYAGRVPAVAGWDSGQTVVRGDGAVGADEELTVGLPVEGPWLPLLGGIVAGAAARLESAVPADGRRRLIDGIPDDIAASVGPDVPARYDARPAERLDGADTRPPETTGPSAGHPDLGTGGTVRRTPDHDGRTTARTAVPGAADVDPFRQPTHETVLAVFCAHGHPTPAYSSECRICHGEVPPQDPRRIPRPRLGGLRLPGGEVVALDRGVVIGRRPAPVDDQGEWPHLVTVPPESSYVSRVHVHVQIDGWLVIVRDLGSRGGTTLRVPGRAPETIRAQEPHVLEPGHALVLADEYEVVYDVSPEVTS
jgi:FHA domain